MHPAVPNPAPTERLAVIAVGGYGRGTLAPGSDIDLLFLFPKAQTVWGTATVEAMLYVLWDLGFKVGHAVRGLDECLKLSRSDITIRTSVLEARTICGDAPLADLLAQRFDKEVVHGTALEFVTAKLVERDERYRLTETSRYVVEPNVKEGKGGLRDINTLFWIAKYAYRVREIEDLVDVGLFTRSELGLFRKAEDFLWAVRCHLHFLTGRTEDRLNFEYQPDIAARLGYQRHPGQSAVERFMKHYFLVAKDVGDLTAIVCAALEQRHAKRPPKLNRFFGRWRRVRTHMLPGTDFTIENERLTITGPDVFTRDPVNLIRFFHTADREDVDMHPDAMHLIRRSLRLIDRDLRENPEANRLFLEVLTSRNVPETILRRMNETGVLGRFIPEFGKIVAMMQFNMYHHYTVDEHLIRAVGILSEMDAGTLKDEHPLSNEILPAITSRVALYVAVLFHDVAKGRLEDHSIAGAKVIAEARAAARPVTRRYRDGGMADRTASPDVGHRAAARHFRSAHDPRFRRKGAEPGAAENAPRPDGLRHQGRRARRVERLERPASALALLGNRNRSRRRPFHREPHRARAGGERRKRAPRCPTGARPNSTPIWRVITRPTGSRSSRSGALPMRGF